MTGLDNKSPMEVPSKQKLNVRNLFVFGIEVMAHVPKKKRSKWDKKAEKKYLAGFSETTKSYNRLYNPGNKNVIMSRYVNIMEDTTKVFDVVITDKQKDGGRLFNSVGVSTHDDDFYDITSDMDDSD